MTHIPGSFTSNWQMTTHDTCPKCRSDQIAYRIWEWESSGAENEDYRYRCLDCGHDWWVDGEVELANHDGPSSTAVDDQFRPGQDERDLHE